MTPEQTIALVEKLRRPISAASHGSLDHGLREGQDIS
jgi:hypothetical protein